MEHGIQETQTRKEAENIIAGKKLLLALEN